MNPDTFPPAIQLVQNATPLWQTLLPVLGSFIVAFGAFIGVVKLNNTNQAAIKAADARDIATRESADRREWTKWRREKLTAHIEDFTSLADDVAASLRGSITWQPKDTKRLLVETNNAQNPLFRIARNTELVVGTALKAELDRTIEAAKILQLTVEQEIATFRQEMDQGDPIGPAFRRIQQRANAVDESIDELLSATRRVLEGIGETTSSTPRLPE